MTTYWQVNPALEPQKLVIRKYWWDECGFNLSFRDIIGHRTVNISFFSELDGVQIMSLHDDVEMEQRLYLLMQEAKLPNGKPFLPAFVRDTAPLIEQVRTLNQFSINESVSLHQYTIITDDFWIDVVSSQPPSVEIKEEDKGTVSL